MTVPLTAPVVTRDSHHVPPFRFVETMDQRIRAIIHVVVVVVVVTAPMFVGRAKKESRTHIRITIVHAKGFLIVVRLRLPHCSREVVNWSLSQPFLILENQMSIAAIFVADSQTDQRPSCRSLEGLTCWSLRCHSEALVAQRLNEPARPSLEAIQLQELRFRTMFFFKRKKIYFFFWCPNLGPSFKDSQQRGRNDDARTGGVRKFGSLPRNLGCL